MKIDLHNLVTAEESYFVDRTTYTATVANLSYPQWDGNSYANLSYSASAGNTVAISTATGTGWAATAKNNGTTHTCGIYVGNATAPVTGQNEGEPKCI